MDQLLILNIAVWIIFFVALFALALGLDAFVSKRELKEELRDIREEPKQYKATHPGFFKEGDVGRLIRHSDVKFWTCISEVVSVRPDALATIDQVPHEYRSQEPFPVVFPEAKQSFTEPELEPTRPILN